MIRFLEIFKKIAFVTIFVAIGGTIIGMVLVLYWLNHPYRPLVFNPWKDESGQLHNTFRILTPVIKQGGTLFYRADYCKYSDLTAVVGRSFANDLVFATPQMTTNREIGCHSIVVGITVPRELPPGIYHLENTYTYQMNPVRKVTIKQNTEEFQIIE